MVVEEEARLAFLVKGAELRRVTKGAALFSRIKERTKRTKRTPGRMTKAYGQVLEMRKTGESWLWRSQHIRGNASSYSLVLSRLLKPPGKGFCYCVANILERKDQRVYETSRTTTANLPPGVSGTPCHFAMAVQVLVSDEGGH